jgi:hypothetical protein
MTQLHGVTNASQRTVYISSSSTEPKGKDCIENKLVYDKVQKKTSMV